MLKLKNKDFDIYLTKLANKLSEINRYNTFPNPSVGAVILKKNDEINYSFTGKGGSPHAEFDLLKNNKNKNIKKIFTSLEPCCHHGKNPPCTDLIIKNKINQVITSAKDQDERVKGKTKKILNKRNISIKYLNLPTLSSTFHNFSKKNKIPYVVSKIAISSDGYTKHNSKRLFTGTLAIKFAHLLRYQSDSILIGRKTLIEDNPKLNCRIPGLEKKLAVFIINKNLIFSKKVLKNKFLKKSYVFHSSKDLYKIKKLKKFFNLIYLDFETKNLQNLILNKIYSLGFVKLLIEGGSLTTKSFLEANLINEQYIIKNNKFFKKNGLIKANFFFKFKKKHLSSKITVEDDVILNYKLKNVYRNNSRNS